MDSKMLNLGRAKKKLRYFQPEEPFPSSIKINNVFSLNELDNIFDDLDSPSGTPPLSPLPPSSELAEQATGDKSPDLKPTSPFGAEEPEVLAPENCIQEDHLNDRGSPFKESAPIKTSSPIDLIPAGDEAGDEVGDAEKPETSPILFYVEDEPVAQRSENLKEFHEDESVVSPPARLEFRRTASEDISVTRHIPVPSQDLENEKCQTLATEESFMDKDSNISPSIVVQNNPSESVPKEQPKIRLIRLPDGKSNVEVKESSFQQKLRNAFKPKSTLKPKVRTQQAPAPSSVDDDDDDDFMILEDDAPVLFTIPKKTDPCKAKPPPEGIHTKADTKKTASGAESAPLKPGEDKNKHRDETDAVKTKRRKTKQGNAHHIDEEGSIAQGTPEERTDPLTEAAGHQEVCEPSPVPEASKESDLPGKPGSRNISSKPVKLGKRNGKDGRAKSTEKPASKMKKPAKGSVDSIGGHEEPAGNRKRKPSKTKSTIKVGDSESDALRFAGPVEQSNGNANLTNQQAPEGPEQGCNVDNITEPPSASTEHPDTADKNASKQPPTKLKRTVKVKKVQKTKDDAKLKVLPVPESDDPREGLETNKRKRRPPGEWWLNADDQNKANTQQQVVQEIKPSKKRKKKEAPAKPLQISANSAEGQESHSEPVRPVTVQKVFKKNKKSNSTGDQKNLKTGGRRKPKSASPVQPEIQPKTSTPVVGEEVAFENIQLSPAACSPPPRPNSLTPGEKEVFENIYTRHNQCRSAQKSPSSVVHQAEIKEKRQRRPTSNWWEVPNSQRSVERARSPLKRSPQKNKPSESASDRPTRVSRSLKTCKQKRMTMVHTPKTVKSSLAMFDSILASVKPASLSVRRLENIQKGRRNLLHSLEDQSEQSSENIPSGQQHGNSHATFDVYTSGVTSGVTMEPSAASKRTSVTFSAGSSRANENDTAFKSGPSSMIVLERFEEHEDCGMPSSKMIPQMQHIPRVMSDCDFCGPPLKPIVLETEDWDNLCVWFAHLWPSSSKDGQVISIIGPDDFHWHSHGGRAMGHMVDLQNNTFSNGKILLGSYMKKPPQVDLHAVTVFNVVTSSVRVEIDGDKTVYNSGQTFMTPCGQPYSIHNVFSEPAVLWYHRMLQNHTKN